jgi:hypothetical protein
MDDAMFAPHPTEPAITRRRLSPQIVSVLNVGESLHADGMNLGNPVLEGSARDLILDLAITQGAFEGDELPVWRVLANFERSLQVKTQCHSVRVRLSARQPNRGVKSNSSNRFTSIPLTASWGGMQSR